MDRECRLWLAACLWGAGSSAVYLGAKEGTAGQKGGVEEVVKGGNQKAGQVWISFLSLK